VPPRNVRFGETFEDWFASDESPKATSTRKMYRAAADNDLLPRLQHRKLAEITLDDLLALVQVWRKRGLARSTIENYLCPVRGTFDYAHRRGLVTSNPCSLLRRRDLESADSESRAAHEWTDDEIAALIRASEQLDSKKESRYQYAPMIRVAIGTGLRLGELLGLEWRDIDLEHGVLEVRRQWNRYGELTPPKTKKALRRVPLTADLVELFRERRKAALSRGQYAPEKPVFASRNGGRLGHRNVQRRGFKESRDKACLPKTLRFHDLRHAFASIAAHRGVPVNILSAVMGHSTIGVTQNTYIHLYGRDAAEQAFRAAMTQAGDVRG
jgi:integrase